MSRSGDSEAPSAAAKAKDCASQTCRVAVKALNMFNACMCSIGSAGNTTAY